MPKTLALIPLKTRVAALGATYDAAAGRIIRALSRLQPDDYSPARAGAVLSEVRDVVGRLDAQVKSWAQRAIKAAYREGGAVAQTRLEMIGAERLPARKYNPERHDKKTAALTKTILTDYWKANRTIERTAKKYILAVSQAAAGVAKVEKKLEQLQAFDSAQVKSFINRTVAASVSAATRYNAGMAHLTSKDIAAKIRAKLLDMIGGGDFITINGRNFNLRSYAELVARTRMRESQTEAVKESMKQFDEDLVEIPEHDNPCPECAQYQGQVYSISGRTPGYPLLPSGGPPWH